MYCSDNKQFMKSGILTACCTPVFALLLQLPTWCVNSHLPQCLHAALPPPRFSQALSRAAATAASRVALPRAVAPAMQGGPRRFAGGSAEELAGE